MTAIKANPKPKDKSKSVSKRGNFISERKR